MRFIKLKKPHLILLVVILVLITLTALVSHASTKIVERTITTSAVDLLESRPTDLSWEFLRNGFVLGRMLSGNEAVYIFTVNLFGGDKRFAIVLQANGSPETFSELGSGAVSPYSARIGRVMDAHAGNRLTDVTAIDTYIAHDIMTSLQTIALYERSRKEAENGE